MTRSTAHSQASFRCEFDAIHDAMAQIAGFAEQAGLAPEEAMKLQLVVEELMTNSIRHGGAGHEARIEIELHDRVDHVDIRYADQGNHFDPTSYRPPPPEDQGEAGYGWVLIRGICRDIDYQRADAANRMSLSLPIEAARNAR